MSAIEVLRNEYPGDLAWSKFLNTFKLDELQASEAELFKTRLGGQEFSLVLISMLGRFAIDWFDQPCRALDNRSPGEVLKHHADGKKILRSLIMRMPS